MLRLRTVLLTATLVCSGIVHADQKNNELPDLFDKLKSANSPQQAVMIEAEIWKKWYERDSTVGGDSMSEAVEAMGTGRYTVALNLLNKLVSDEPDFAEAWNRRATIHYLLGNYQDSLADIEQALSLEPRHFGALSGIGLIMQQLGENEKALHAFEQVLEISPQNYGAAKSIKALESKLGVSI